MSEFEITAPDGKRYQITAPEGATQDQALQYFRSQHPEMEGAGQDRQQQPQQQQQPPSDPSAGDGSFRAGAEDFLHGLSSGVAGDIVGAGQLVRHVLPDSFTNWVANSRLGQGLEREAQRSSQGIPGQIGSFVGATAPFMALPGLSAARGWGPASRVLTRSTLPAAIQPVDPNNPNYWDTKALQAGAGTVAGEALQKLGQIGATALQNIRGSRIGKALSDLVEDINRQIRDENTGRQTRYEAQRDRTQGINQKIQARNEGIDERYNQARVGQQQSAYNERLGIRATKQAQNAIPGQTTLNWWREALTPIGEQARAPTRVTPEATAQVRQIIGDRLNHIREQMLLNPDHPGFHDEIEAIRHEVEGQITNQGIRDKWSYHARNEYDRDGNALLPSRAEIARERNTEWSKYVEQPLEDLQYLHGRQFSDYVSRLGDLAEQYAQRAARAPQAESPELYAIARGLRRVVDVAERHGTSDPALMRQLTDAKRSYNLWSIGNGATAAEKGGVMTPGGIAREWARRQGDAPYAAEMIPGHPQFHPENARLKQGLENARQAHETTPPPITPQPPIPRPTTKWSQIPLPKRPRPVREGAIPQPPPPTPPSPGAQAVKGVGRKMIAHGLAGLPGVIAEPFVTAGAKKVANSPAAAKALSQAGRAGPVAAVGTSQTIPEIVVTAPRYRPGEENEEKK